MTEKEALEILIVSLQNYSMCGRLKSKELEAVKILRTYFKDKEK